MKKKHRIIIAVGLAFILIAGGVLINDAVNSTASSQNGPFRTSEVEEAAVASGITAGVPAGFHVCADPDPWDLAIYYGDEWSEDAVQAAIYIFDEGEGFGDAAIDPASFGLDALGIQLITYVVELDSSRIDKTSANGYPYYRIDTTVNGQPAYAYYTWLANRIIAVMMVGDDFRASPTSQAILESISFSPEGLT